jgi:hypothetical protein
MLARPAQKPVQNVPQPRRERLLELAILGCLTPGNGRSNRATADELSERLAAGGVSFTPSALDEALVRLSDCGQIVRAQRQGHAPQIARAGVHPYDEADAPVPGWRKSEACG